MDFKNMTTAKLRQMRIDIDAHLKARSGKGVNLAGSEWPSYGAVLRDAPASGGDSDTWFPTTEAAQAALALMTGVLTPNGMSLDYTARGCSSSMAWIQVI